MPRTVFIGSKNEFNEILVHWLSQRVELVGVVWTKSTAWQRTSRGRLEFAKKRMRRYGPFKVINETLFFLYFHAFMEDRDMAELHRQVIEPYKTAHENLSWNGDSIFTMDVNSPEVLSFLEAKQPDIALAMCINFYFGKKLRAIPKQGVFLWHEGYTPEYKGLYSPFWAVHNLDFERIGYTLLRMNDNYDAGEVFVQGPALGIDPFHHGHLYAGHKAIYDSLPAVEDFFTALDAGSAKPLSRPNAQSQNYTYPGLSDLARQRVRLWRLARSNQRRSVEAR